jgi:hypothetical protein
MPPSAIRLDQMDALELPELLVLVVPTFFAGAVVVLGASVPCLESLRVRNRKRPPRPLRQLGICIPLQPSVRLKL